MPGGRLLVGQFTTDPAPPSISPTISWTVAARVAVKVVTEGLADLVAMQAPGPLGEAVEWVAREEMRRDPLCSTVDWELTVPQEVQALMGEHQRREALGAVAGSADRLSEELCTTLQMLQSSSANLIAMARARVQAVRVVEAVQVDSAEVVEVEVVQDTVERGGMVRVEGTAALPEQEGMVVTEAMELLVARQEVQVPESAEVLRKEVGSTVLAI